MRQRRQNPIRPRDYSREYYDYPEDRGYRNQRIDPRRDRSGKRRNHTPNYQRVQEEPYKLFANRREGAWRNPHSPEHYRNYGDKHGHSAQNKRNITPDRTNYFDSRDKRDRSFDEITPRDRSRKQPFLPHDGRMMSSMAPVQDKRQGVWYNRDNHRGRDEGGWREKGRGPRDGRHTERSRRPKERSMDYNRHGRYSSNHREREKVARGRSAYDDRGGRGPHFDDQRPQIVRYGRNGYMGESSIDSRNSNNPIKRRFSKLISGITLRAILNFIQFFNRIFRRTKFDGSFKIKKRPTCQKPPYTKFRRPKRIGGLWNGIFKEVKNPEEHKRRG